MMEPKRSLTPQQIEKRKRAELDRIEEAQSRRGERATKAEVTQHENEQKAAEIEEKHKLADKARAGGLRKTTVRAPDGSTPEVWAAPMSFAKLGFQDHHIAVAERFNADWEIAYAPLKGQGYEPAVDGGRSPHGPHSARIAAQERLRRCRSSVGARNWEIITAVVIKGASARKIAQIAGVHHRTIKWDMDRAFDRLDGFYNGSSRRDKSWIAFSRFNEEKEAS